jgi:hypothetical protein
MGKLQDKNTLTTKPSVEMVLRPIAGWTWYCGYHDTAGQGDDFQECQYMAGAHIMYHEIDGEVCELYYREHEVKEEA